MNDRELSVLLFLLFAVKHFVIDFPLQTRYQLSNKGTYGHPGGILHAGLHGIGTWACFAFFSGHAAVYAIVDAVVHYHVDWAKAKVNSRFAWQPVGHDQFWWLLGFDQFLHYLTYIALIGFFMRVF